MLEFETYVRLENKLKEPERGQFNKVSNGVHMAKILGDYLNGHGSSASEIDDLMAYMTHMEHRTIQNTFFCDFVMRAIEYFALMDEMGQIDERNWMANEIAKKLYTFMRENNMVSNRPVIK